MNTELCVNKLHEKLEKIERTLQLLEDVLACVSVTEERYRGYSDKGWLLSMVAESPGILLAVLFGRSSLSWQNCAHEIEKTIMTLQIDKRLLEWELHKR